MSERRLDRPDVVRSLDRALGILEMLAYSEEELPLGEVAARVELPKSTVHRLLRTMELRGFVVRDPLSGGYRRGVGPAPRPGFGAAAHQALVSLAQSSGETANLGTLVGREVMYVDRADSPQALRWQLTVGSRVPAHAAALGKAILAHLGPEVVRRLLPRRLTASTRRTITDRNALLEELAAVRRRGFAIDDEEFMDGVRCVGAPVFDEAGRVVGAVSLAGPAFRLTPETAAHQARPVVAAAHRVSLSLGYRQARRGEEGA
jgi:DNA-binding IclR family transcriptional regulator